LSHDFLKQLAAAFIYGGEFGDPGELIPSINLRAEPFRSRVVPAEQSAGLLQLVAALTKLKQLRNGSTFW